MLVRTVRLASVLLLAAAFPLPARLLAQQPRVTDAQSSTQPAGELTETLDALRHGTAAPPWGGYVFPTQEPVTSGSGTDVIHLEQSKDCHRYRGGDCRHTADGALVLLRLSGGEVNALRLAQVSDALDAGGLRFVLLTGAQADQSVAALVRISRYPEVRKQAVFWLGQSQDPAALAVLTSILQQPTSSSR